MLHSEPSPVHLWYDDAGHGVSTDPFPIAQQPMGHTPFAHGAERVVLLPAPSLLWHFLDSRSVLDLSSIHLITNDYVSSNCDL